MFMRRPAKKGRYHHGDLPTALIDTAIELIAERGVAGFSLAEASRRLGVTVAAPYRHFADRDELLAAVAVRASRALSDTVAAETGHADTPAEQLAAAARAYVRFAAANLSLFQALFAAGLDKSRHPELESAAQPVMNAFFHPARTLCGDDNAAEDLAFAVVATAHGHAMLLVDKAFGDSENAVEAAVAKASNATLALVSGRDAFIRTTGD
jgi:AcrR family transcriptional regulator